MSKNISTSDLPYGITYHVDSHNGYQGREHEPHVRIYGKGCDVKYSVRTGRYMEGKFDGASQKDIERWVSKHLSELWNEWKESDDPKGGMGS